MQLSARATTAKHRRLAAEMTDILSHGLEAGSPKPRCWQARFLLRPLLLACRPWFCFIYAHPSNPPCALISSYRDSGPIGLGPTLLAFNLITL